MNNNSRGSDLTQVVIQMVNERKPQTVTQLVSFVKVPLQCELVGGCERSFFAALVECADATTKVFAHRCINIDASRLTLGFPNGTGATTLSFGTRPFFASSSALVKMRQQGILGLSTLPISSQIAVD